MALSNWATHVLQRTLQKVTTNLTVVVNLQK